MNDSSKAWLPSGLPLEVARTLSVIEPGLPMTPSLYRELLTARLDELIKADPKAARRALEMSQEQAPELWAIAEQYPISQWASALVRSDQMNALISQMRWTGMKLPAEPPNLLEILELLA